MDWVCKDCGTNGRPKIVTRGSILIEIILWLCFLVPGLIYSIWRLTTRHKACGTCGSKSIVPIDSPIGRKLVEGRVIEPGAAENFGRKVGEMFRKK